MFHFWQFVFDAFTARPFTATYTIALWQWHTKWAIFHYFPPLLPRPLSLGSLYIHFVLFLWSLYVLLCVSHLFTPACVLCCWLYFKEDILIKDSTMASITLRFIDFVGFIFDTFSMTRAFLFSFECCISHHFERKGLTSQDTVTTKNYHLWI